MTLAKGVNMINAEGYSRLIEKADPTYLEPKAAMAVGFFTRRLPWKAMPFYREIREFAESLSRLTGYGVINEAEPSGVVLLSKLKKARKLTG
jgi:tRNA wybutosine-synthesizing protein 1